MLAVAGWSRDVPGDPDVSWPDFRDFEKNCTLFDAFIVDRITGVTLAIGDKAEVARASIVSANYFSALGVRPILGRGFEPLENIGRNAHPVTVISYQLWQSRYKSDPDIIGKTQMLNGMPHTIIGVAPEGFYGTFVGWAMEFWVPLSMQEKFDSGGYKLEDRGETWIEGFVRLKPGVTLQQAQAEIFGCGIGRLETAYPATNRNRGVNLFPLWRTPFNNARTMFPTLGIALAVVIAILLIACANVGNLLLVRAFGRRHEMTIRLAVGAGRSRLLKQLLTEGLILATIAAAGGFLMAYWSRNLFVLLLPARGGSRMNLPGEIDWRVLALSTGVCLISTLLFGLVPALQTSKIDLTSALKAEAGGVVRGRRRGLVRSGRSWFKWRSASFCWLERDFCSRACVEFRISVRAFPPVTLTTGVDFEVAGYDRQRSNNFQDALIDRLQSLGGVQSATIERTTPFGYRSYSSAPIAVEGFETAPDQKLIVDYNEVGPAYLATMGIPLVSGREFTRADNETAPPVAVVNDVMAALYWRGRDPVGSRLQVKGKWLQVVGVARVSKYERLDGDAQAVLLRAGSPKLHGVGAGYPHLGLSGCHGQGIGARSRKRSMRIWRRVK